MSFDHYALIWGLDLPHTHKLVLLALGDHANGGHECWPSIETLAAKTGLHRSTVMRALQALSEDGWIARTPRGHQSTLYRLKVGAWCDSRTARPSSTERPQVVAESDPDRRTARQELITESINEQTTNKKARSELLEALS